MGRDPIRVLHVDDDRSLSELTATFLEREDDRFAVETAASVGEALARFEDGDLDCIVSDFDVPDRNGIEFLEAVRERDPDLPFVLFTGKGSEEVASDAISAGVTDYLRKETGTDQFAILANRVRNAVERYRLEREAERTRDQPGAILEHSRDVVLTVDEESRIRFVNPAVEDHLGYAPADLAGESLTTIMPEGQREAHLDGVERFLETGERTLDWSDTEFHALHADGTEIPFSISFGEFEEDGESRFIGVMRDVTERRERERELRRSRALLRHTERLAGTGGWEIDVATDQQRWTEGTYEIRDVSPSTYEPTIESSIEFYHPADRETIRRAVERCVEDGEPFDEELRLVTAEDRLRWVRAAGEATTDEDGDRLVRGAIQDVTERKERARELERTNALLSTLVETLPVGVLAEDASRNVLAVNARFFELFGLPGTPAETVGADCERLADRVSGLFVEPGRFVDRIDALVERREPVDGETLELRDGRQFTRSYRPIELPDGEGHLWVYRDVTERVERERELAENGETLERLHRTTQRLLEAADADEATEIVFESIEDVLDFDVVGLWTANAARDRLEPVALTEAGADLVPEPPTYSPEEQSLSWDAFERDEILVIDDLTEHDGRLNRETPIRSEIIVPLGEFGLMNVGATEPDAFGEHDEALLDLWADTVTTALARIERERELQERETELLRERDRLEEFASVVSHDLRNPLNVAQGRLQFLREECDSDNLDEVARAHERMDQLIDDLLTLAREGDEVSDAGTVDLAALTEDCWRNVVTADAALRLETDRRIRADDGRLTQLLENLLRNAVEHGSTRDRSAADDEHGSTSPPSPADDADEHGGGSVTITVGHLPDGFYVADDGPGIPEPEREAVFDAGYSTAADGTGFGLSIVEEVADAHGWDVGVTDGPDGGTRFEVTGVEFVD